MTKRVHITQVFTPIKHRKGLKNEALVEFFTHTSKVFCTSVMNNFEFIVLLLEFSEKLDMKVKFINGCLLP